MKFNYYLLALILLLLVGFVVDSKSTDFTVTWNSNQDADLAGYKVYYGIESRIYTSLMIVTDNFKSFKYESYYPFNDSTEYFFAVTAFDSAGNESGYSNEESIFIIYPDTTAPATPGGCTIICN